MDYRCNYCGAVLNYHHPFCGQCGQKVEWSAAVNPQQELNTIQQPLVSYCPGCQAPLEQWQPACTRCGQGIDWRNNRLSFSTAQQAAYPDNAVTQNVAIVAPALQAWKTSIAFSILGVIAGYGVSYSDLLFSIVLGDSSGPILYLCVAVAYSITAIVYALAIYPSLFRQEPRLKSRNAISFLNCFFGGIIFGPLWNNNLTKHKKGISNIVFVVLPACLLAISFLATLLVIVLEVVNG